MHPQLEISDKDVSIRLCRVSDDPVIEQLAALEGREVPKGRQVVAEVNGVVVAALPLDGGAPLADPFRPTANLLPLMRRHAARLRAKPRARMNAAWHFVVDRPLV